LRSILVQAKQLFWHVEQLFRKNTQSVQLKPELVFTLNRNECSGWAGICTRSLLYDLNKQLIQFLLEWSALIKTDGVELLVVPNKTLISHSHKELPEIIPLKY